MPDRGDTRALVHVEADVTLRRQPRLARAQPIRTRIGPPASARWQSAAAATAFDARECDEKRITLRVDLDALVLGQHRAEAPPMLVQRLPESSPSHATAASSPPRP
jgi:hypothetical protein